MKKLLFISLVATASIFNSNTSSAQGAFQYGDNILGVGVGFGTSLGYFGGGTESPAISVQYEHGNWAVGGPGVISLGGYLGYQSFSYSYTNPYYLPPPYNNTYYSYSETLSYWVIGLRSAYHYNGLNTKDWDLYGGLMLSYDIASFSHSSNVPGYDYGYGSYGSGVDLSLYLGARYFVSNKFALFAEIGYGISDFTLGGAFRL